MASLMFVFFLPLLVLCVPSHGREILIGGSINSWKVPSSSSPQSLNHWAESTRFQVGDSLVWSYDGDKDSVMEVTRDDYYACRTSNPTAVHRGGQNNVKLSRSGAYYFISGAAESCAKGERLIVVVISQKHATASSELLAPAPAPTPEVAPAIAGDATRGFVGVGVAAAALGFVGVALL